MEDTGGKSGRRPGRHLQVEASGPGNAASVQQRLAGRFGGRLWAEGWLRGARLQSRCAGGLLGTRMEDTGGKSGRRPGRHLQVEASGPCKCHECVAQALLRADVLGRRSASRHPLHPRRTIFRTCAARATRLSASGSPATGSSYFSRPCFCCTPRLFFARFLLLFRVIAAVGTGAYSIFVADSSAT